MISDRTSSIATPFFKQLIISENSDNFLLEKERCLEFFKFMKGQTVECKNFRKVKLNTFFREYREINKYYPCALIKENSSWISADENGEYRYFSRKPNGKVFVFDILDLFQIGYKLNYKELVAFFKQNLDIFIQDKFFKAESDKYTSNVEFITTETYENSICKEMVKEKEDIYIELNKIGSENLFSKTLTHMEDAMFFASTSYIKSRLNDKYSASTINKVINMFSVMGMLNKIKEEDIPVEFKESNKRKIQNFTSYYSIPKLEDIFNIVEKNSAILKENNVHYYNITKKKVLDLYGKEAFKGVYVQKTYEGKSVSKDDTNYLSNLFLNLFDEYKYVSKDLFVKNCYNPAHSKSFLEKEFDNYVKSNGFRFIRPNNRLKKKLGLTSNSSIAIK